MRSDADECHVMQSREQRGETLHVLKTTGYVTILAQSFSAGEWILDFGF